MAYTPPAAPWADDPAGGTPITAAQLNRIEGNAEDADTRLSAVEPAVAGKTQVSVDGSPVSTLDISSTAVTDLSPATAADHNFLGWSYDPGVTAGGQALTAGVVYLTRIRLAACTVGSVAAFASNQGTTLTNTYMGLFNTAGTRLGVTADRSSDFQTAGVKICALTAPVTVTSGFYYVAILANGTTPPTLIRGGNTSGINAGLAAPNFRFCTSGTGLTALPSSITMASTSGSSAALWVAAKA